MTALDVLAVEVILTGALAGAGLDLLLRLAAFARRARSHRRLRP
jgi:hypothetical protein